MEGSTIVGLASEDKKPKHLFSADQVQECQNISPYLIPGANVICTPRDEPISDLAPMKMGSNAVDGKRLILGNAEALEIVSDFPDARPYLKKYGGTKEMVSGTHRWCLWVSDDEAADASKIRPLGRIIGECRSYREGAGRDARKSARRPHAFCYSTFEDRDFIQVGNTIGNLFDFVPADLQRRGFVSNHNAFTIYGMALLEFSLIVSTLHRVWAETISGHLGDGTRYGNTVVYNTFPVPGLTDQNKAALTRCAENILMAREAHFPATIAELYDPDGMPDDLRHAHDENDETLERIFIGRRFRNDTERLEKLFELYTRMTAAQPPTKKKGRKAA